MHLSWNYLSQENVDAVFLYLFMYHPRVPNDGEPAAITHTL